MERMSLWELIGHALKSADTGVFLDEFKKAFDDGFVFGNQRKWTGLYYNGLVLD
jgi:hypothetical protein